MTEAPSAFVVRWLSAVPPAGAGRALDVAAGAGRHARRLASAGYTVFAVDRDLEVLRAGANAARAGRLHIRAWVADLERVPHLPSGFDLVVCTRYLQRTLVPSLRVAVRPDGLLLYETFTLGQLRHARGPRSPDHLLRPGELKEWFADWHVLEYEETETPDALARLAARRPH